MAIKRVWHGWTTPEDAGRYQDLLHNEVLPVYPISFRKMVVHAVLG
jgi:hypothetical protein